MSTATATEDAMRRSHVTHWHTESRFFVLLTLVHHMHAYIVSGKAVNV